MYEEFERLLEDAKENLGILGLFLTGSRGKGFENAYSDYDAMLIVADNAKATLEKTYKDTEIDLTVFTLDELKNYATWGSPEAWDRYDFAHTKILVDKTGTLPDILKEKGSIPPEKQKEFIEWWIDGYVNGVFRSVKCIRNGNSLGAHLHAANSMNDLLTLVFALNGRHRPFLDYVEKEMQTHPLEHLPWSADVFTAKIRKVLESADLSAQQELLKGMEVMGRDMGYGHMFDGWKGKDKWAMTFHP
jgi:hypothetical protein